MDGSMIQWPKQRVWGWYATLIRTPWFCLKLLRFRPNGALSMQRHQHRTEIWWFIRGLGLVEHNQVGACTNVLFTRWDILPNQWHKFTAYNKPVYAIEVQYGKKVTELDIERKDA